MRVRTLKDGFKELEANYNNRPPTIFRDSYLKKYSQEQLAFQNKYNSSLNNLQKVPFITIFFLHKGVNFVEGIVQEHLFTHFFGR